MNKVIIYVGAAIVAIVLMAGVYQFGSMSGARASEPTPMPSPTPTPLPTVPPTPNLPVHFEEENKYRQSVLTIFQGYEEQIGIIVDQEAQFEESLSGLEDDEALIYAAKWNNTMLPTTLAIKRLGSQVNALTPPTRYELVHADLVYAAALYDEAVTMQLEGVSEINARKVVEAQTIMASGSRAMEDVYYKITGTTKAK